MTTNNNSTTGSTSNNTIHTNLSPKEKERILKKMEKLLAMAERAKGNEEEAANAARQLANMLKKYNMSMTDINLAQVKSDITADIISKYKWTANRSPLWVNALCIGVSIACETKVLWSHSQTNDSWVKKPQMHLKFYGMEMDVKASILLFDYLYKTVIRLSTEYGKTQNLGKKARTVLNSYRAGMAYGLVTRLKEIDLERQREQEELTKKNPGTSLMVMKSQAIDEYFGRKITYGSSNRGQTFDGMAYNTGHQDSKNVSFSKQLT